MRDIAEYLVKALGEERDLVLVTVTGGTGSAPRHAGSQMLVSAAGLACGTIGGGALEAHAIAEAHALLGGAEGRFEHLNLEADLGMACGGGASVLYTPVCAGDASWAQVARETLRCLDTRTSATLLLRCPEGERPFATAVGLIGEDGGLIAGDCAASVVSAGGELGGGHRDASLIAPSEHARESLNAARVQLVEDATAAGSKSEEAAGGCAALFVDSGDDRVAEHPVALDYGLAGATTPCWRDSWFALPLPIPVRAVVFGAGHVGRATVAALSRVGFSCTVFDNRPAFARPEDFPAAQTVVCGDYSNIAASLTLDERDFILIMTPGHRSDFTVLEQVLRQPHAYVGLIGSRRKIAAAREQMLAAGIPQAALDAVHMPIGLEIGAETPEEIAVSIAAECILERAKR